jgi:hypothetical protein
MRTFPSHPLLVVVGFALSIIAALPAQAGGANVRLSIRLEAPAAMLRCQACMTGQISTTTVQAVSTLSDLDPERRGLDLGRFLSHGVRIGHDRFAGLSVDLRRADDEAGVARYVAI